MLTAQQQHTLRANTIAKAVSHIGDREIGYTNTGPEVDRFLADVGLPPGNSWCEAFGCFCVNHAALEMGILFADTALVKTGLVQAQVNHAVQHGTYVSAHDVTSGLTSLRPGDMMCEWEPALHRYAHTGLLEVVPSVTGNAFVSIEGNTDLNGSRQGFEVARQHRNAADHASDGRPKYCFVRMC